MEFIPQIEPWIDQNELKHLARLVENRYVVENQLTLEFEKLVQNQTGAKHVISVANGTLALYCCLKSLNIGPGDEVIVPNLTFIATANSVIMAGATPVFCDVDKDSMCIDINQIENYITPKTKAIIPVHLYGNSADLYQILELSNKYNLPIIEDAAQGVGVLYDNKHVGTFGKLGILSYYGNKTITCGEGGIILTDDDNLAKACYRLKNHGRDKKGVFKHEHIGFNFSFTEMQAAIGISQMEKFDKIAKRKKEIHDIYVQELLCVGDLIPQKFGELVSPIHWFTSFLTQKKSKLSEFLLKSNIQTRDFFYPLDLQPCYELEPSGKYPQSHYLYDNGISLPSSYNLTNEQQDYIINKIKNFYN